MCVWTSIRKVSQWTSLILAVIAIVTAWISFIVSRVSAWYKIDTLRDERKTNLSNIQQVKDDVTTIKNDVSWLKEYVQKK